MLYSFSLLRINPVFSNNALISASVIWAIFPAQSCKNRHGNSHVCVKPLSSLSRLAGLLSKAFQRAYYDHDKARPTQYRGNANSLRLWPSGKALALLSGSSRSEERRVGKECG